MKNQNIVNEKDLFEYLNKNEFQWGLIIDGEKTGNITSQTYTKLWKLKNFQQMVRDRIAICWDYANFEKQVFNGLGMKSSTYIIVHDNDMENNPSHAFTVIEEEKNIKLVEYSFIRHAGIYDMDSLNDIIDMQLRWRFEMPNDAHLKHLDVKVYKVPNELAENMIFTELVSQKENWEVVLKKDRDEQIQD
ncbi:MAG TPA: hypothetical protein DEP72_02800 [Clostridiales bacterium]|nr:hypothetical protein [Clostridiales bacterium]